MRISYISESKYEALAENLIKEFRGSNYNNCLDTYDSEVDVISMASYLGYKISKANLKEGYGENTLGMIVPEAKVIFYDLSIEPQGDGKELKEKILRFTIAHEISHHILHQKHFNDNNHALYYTKLDSKEINVVERQANRLSSSLLLPRGEFIRKLRFFEIKNNNYNSDKSVLLNKVINSLSEHFLVSKMCVNIRIKELSINIGESLRI